MYNTGETSMIARETEGIYQELDSIYENSETYDTYEYDQIVKNPLPFLNAVSKIKVRNEKYKNITYFLLKRLGIDIDKSFLIKLFEFIETAHINKISPAMCTKDDLHAAYDAFCSNPKDGSALYALLSGYVLQCYMENGMETISEADWEKNAVRKQWAKKFAKLLLETNNQDIYEFVLSMNMSVEACNQFFTEALGRSELDLFNAEEALLYIVLRQGRGGRRLYDYRQLRTLYLEKSASCPGINDDGKEEHPVSENGADGMKEPITDVQEINSILKTVNKSLDVRSEQVNEYIKGIRLRTDNEPIIHSVEKYENRCRFILTYLLKKMQISLNKEQTSAFLKFVQTPKEKVQLIKEAGKGNVDSETAAFLETLKGQPDWRKLYAVLSEYVKEEYDESTEDGNYITVGSLENGKETEDQESNWDETEKKNSDNKIKPWKAEFGRLLKEPKNKKKNVMEEGVRDLYRFALAMNMSVDECSTLFEETLGRTRNCFAAVEEVLVYLVLSDKGENKNLSMFDKLNEYYELGANSEYFANKLDRILLSAEDLFDNRNSELKEYIREILKIDEEKLYNKSAVVYRRKREQYDYLVEQIRELLNGGQSFDTLLAELYGGKATKKKKIWFSNYDSSSILNSSLLEDTCIVNTSSMHMNEASWLEKEKGRNLLLTLLFIRTALENPDSLDREEVLRDFEIEADRLGMICGIRPFNRRNPYDRFLYVLLSCDNPYQLYSDLWNEAKYPLSVYICVSNELGRTCTAELENSETEEVLYGWEVQPGEGIYHLPRPEKGKYRIKILDGKRKLRSVAFPIDRKDLMSRRPNSHNFDFRAEIKVEGEIAMKKVGRS